MARSVGRSRFRGYARDRSPIFPFHLFSRTGRDPLRDRAGQSWIRYRRTGRASRRVASLAAAIRRASWFDRTRTPADLATYNSRVNELDFIHRFLPASKAGSGRTLLLLHGT